MSGARPAIAGGRAVIGSIAFYASFYGGTFGFLAAAFVALPFSRPAFDRVTLNWARYHRACLRLFVGIRVEVSGPAPPPGALVAIKHQSFFEAIDQPYLLGNPAIFAKAELLRVPLWGRAAAAYGLIPIERDQGASALRRMLAAARERLSEGRRLVIFPEGTRVPPGAAPPLKAGFAGLYKLLGVAVVPVAVDSGRLYARTWKRAGTIRVVFGRPIAPGLPRATIEARVHAGINALGHADR